MKIGIVGDKDSGLKLVTQLKRVSIDAQFISDGLHRNPAVLARLARYDVIHGIYMRRFVALALILAKLLGKATICHWEGSDILNFNSSLQTRLMTRFLEYFVDCNLVFSENLQDELADVGIEALVLPVPIGNEYFSDDLPSLPKRLTVLAKIADTNLYYGEAIFAIARNIPTVKFYLVPVQDKRLIEIAALTPSLLDLPDNVVYLGWHDNLAEVYKDCTVLVRLTKHDGMSYMVLEALALGRHVIWNHSYVPYCHVVKELEDVIKVLKRLEQKVSLNVRGARFVRENFSPEIITRRLTRIYQEVGK